MHTVSRALSRVAHDKHLSLGDIALRYPGIVRFLCSNLSDLRAIALNSKNLRAFIDESHNEHRKYNGGNRMISNLTD